MPPRTPDQSREGSSSTKRPVRDVLGNIASELDRVGEELRETVSSLDPADLPAHARDQLMWALVDLGRARTSCVGALRAAVPPLPSQERPEWEEGGSSAADSL